MVSEVPPSVYSVLIGLAGVLLGGYGVVREAFRDLATGRPFGEGRYGEGPYGGRPNALVSIGVRLRLLPRDRELTLRDRQRNAALAIAGLVLVVLSMLLEVFLWLR